MVFPQLSLENEKGPKAKVSMVKVLKMNLVVSCSTYVGRYRWLTLDQIQTVASSLS